MKKANWRCLREAKMRSRQIIEATAEPRVLASPLAVLLTERIHSEWEIARDAVVFPEEMVDLARIVQSTLDEQKNLLSLATGRKNEEMTAWYGWSLALVVAVAAFVALWHLFKYLGWGL